MLAQERWLGLFDRGRSMSLLLFEHIHGESRDRGQAMVDLIETYRKHGFELASKELPDYLPLVLEYLSLRPAEEIKDWLGHTSHILELLAARAVERESPYALLFEILVEIGQGKVDLTLMRQRVAREVRDDTPEAMDQVWEEEAVRFGPEAPADDCAPPRRLPAGRPDCRTQGDCHEIPEHVLLPDLSVHRSRGVRDRQLGTLRPRCLHLAHRLQPAAFRQVDAPGQQLVPHRRACHPWRPFRRPADAARGL